MARQLRIEYEGAFYHVTSRGNQKERIFWDDNDCNEFKTILKRTKDRYGYLLHAYVLMDNHYHLLIETPYANLKQVMQNINTSYTVYVNRRHNRAGHLLQGRYKAFIVDKESYLLEMGRYIHLNTVRSGIVKRPEDYKWSSYREYIFGKTDEAIADTEDTLSLFSRRRAIACKEYEKFVYGGIKNESPLVSVVGSILGDRVFRERVIKNLEKMPDKTEVAEIRRIEPKYRVEDIIEAVAEYYRVREDELLERKKATGRQRRVAIYLCKTLSGEKNIEVGRFFGITLQAVTNVLRDVEKMIIKDRELSKDIVMIKESMKK